MKGKNLIVVAIIFIYFLNIIKTDPAGVRIAIKDESIKKVQMKLLPLLIDELNKVTVPNQHIDVDVKLATLHINLNNIKFHVDSLLPENVSVVFNEPNKINVSGSNIKGNGSVEAQYKLLFVSETDNIDIKINKLNFNIEVTLSRKESTKEKGKFLPYAEITNVVLDLDFDFDIHGSIIANIISLVKGLIKNSLTNVIVGPLKDIIKDESKKALDNLIQIIPVYVPIMDNGLAVDYSVLSDPKVTKNYLILSSYGGIVNLNNPATKTPPYIVPDNLPDFIENNKSVQVFLSEFSIDTALNSLFLSNLLNIAMKTEDIPGPVKFNTSTIDIVINGLEKMYGKDKDIVLDCKSSDSPPVVHFKDGKATGDSIGQCTLQVRLDSGELDDALSFKSTISFVGIANIQEGGKISGKVLSLAISNTTLIASKVPGTDIKQVEGLFNLAVQFGLPTLNEYLKSITIPLPTFEGITFNDSVATINDNYATAEVSVTVSESFEKFLRRKVSEEII